MSEIIQDQHEGYRRLPTEAIPTAVNVSRAERALSLTWSPTHVSRFGLDDLRSMCDCAQCRADREKAEAERKQSPRSLPILGAARRADITSINHVGRYALGVGWEDGHQSIFTYEYLLRSCSCRECARAVEG
ncbi:MAG TPA: DUF971 domain-containing protein [Blastocatellia bacterium]|nr:DUF971 domain-containing protein [Blastocatellia bacterium]